MNRTNNGANGANHNDNSNDRNSNRNNVGHPPAPGKNAERIDTETREHWLALAEKQGIDETLTEIHNEIGLLEPQVFAGGFSQERFDRVQSLRLLSRELWNIKLRKQTEKAYGEAEATKSFGHIAKSERK